VPADPKGEILEIPKGETTALFRVDVGGTTVIAAITNKAVDELGLVASQEAYAVVKASDVSVATD
jgi:molybdopterin-binding protein